MLQGYRDAAAVNTAIELDLFTRIAHGNDTASKIASELSIPVRGVRLLCEYLAASGLLQKEDELLSLTPEAATFLDRKSARYIGEDLRALYSPALLRGFEQLTSTVRNGPTKTAMPVRPAWFDLARGISDMAAATGAFIDAMALPDGPMKILEIGSGEGAFGIAIAQRYTKAIVVAADAAEAHAEAQLKAEAAGLGTRYQNIPGDPVTVELGSRYDAVILPRALIQFEVAQLTTLFMRLPYALKKSGRLFLLDVFSEDSAEFLRVNAGFRLNVLAATPRGDAWSFAELKGMLESSGFHGIEARPLPEAGATFVSALP